MMHLIFQQKITKDMFLKLQNLMPQQVIYEMFVKFSNDEIYTFHLNYHKAIQLMLIIINLFFIE